MTRSAAGEGNQVSAIRRLLRLGCGLCAVLILVTSGCAGISPASGPAFHRDPSTVRERYEAWLLFAHLGSALQAVASEEFGRSGEQFADVAIDRAHLPSNLVDLASRHVELCNELADTIESVYDTLEQVERMLAVNDVQRAGAALATCRSLIVVAREQMEALEAATLEVFAMLRRSGSGGTTAQLDQARQSLDVALARLLQLTLDYESRVAAAQAEAEVKRVLSQPEVSLQLDRDAAWVGETIQLSGAVTVSAETLADRELLILLDGIEVARARSGSQGRFSYGLLIPFEYVPLRVIQVSFEPVGNDLDRYRPALSAELVLTVRFHQSQMTVEPPGGLYPGLATTLAGKVESSGKVEGREMEAWWGHVQVGSGLTGPSGEFRCPVTLPADAKEGSDWLRLLAAGDDEALTAPVTMDVQFQVARLAPRIDVSISPVLVVPTPSLSFLRQLLGGDFVRMVPVSGEVRAELPMDTPAMTASWGERETRWQQQGTLFEREAPLIISVWSMGIRTVTVRAMPREPWLRPGEAQGRLVVVNLFMPVVWLLALLAAFAVGSAARRRWAAAGPLRIAPAGLGAALSSRPSVAGVGSMEESGTSSRLALVVLYYRAVGFLQTTLGVGMKSEMTLREYLAASTRRLPAATRLFARLTALAEQAMYGPREPEHRELSLGRRLLDVLKLTRRGDRPDDEENTR
jgi:hypothetical protein